MIQANMITAEEAEMTKQDILMQLDALKAYVGDLETQQELANLADYFLNTPTRIDYHRRITTWKALIDADAKDEHNHNPTRILLETTLFEKTYQTFDFFFQNGEKIFDAGMEEFNSAISMWMCLDCSNGLGVLAEGVACKTMKNNGGTLAEIFRAFMDDYQRREKFTKWTMEFVIAMRYKIYETFNDFHCKRKKRTQDPIDSPAVKKQKIINKYQEYCIGQSSGIGSGIGNSNNAPISPSPKKDSNNTTPAATNQDSTSYPESQMASPIQGLINAPKDILDKAANVGRLYSTSRAALVDKENQEIRVAKRCAAARKRFLDLVEEIADEDAKCFDDFRLQGSNWKIPQGEALIEFHTEMNNRLRDKFNSGDVKGALLGEDQAKAELRVAQTDVETFKEKKQRVDNAMKALQELSKI